MKILLINGSPKKEGNTYIALHEVQKTLEAEGIETELIHVGHKAIVGAGSVVTKDVEANTIVAGNPAKVIKHIV